MNKFFSQIHLGIPTVQIFLEGHKNLAILPLFIWHYLVVSNSKRKMGQIFVAFSEYRNLIFFKKAGYFKFGRLIILCSLEDWKPFQSFALKKIISTTYLVKSVKPKTIKFSWPWFMYVIMHHSCKTINLEHLSLWKYVRNRKNLATFLLRLNSS